MKKSQTKKEQQEAYEKLKAIKLKPVSERTFAERNILNIENRKEVKRAKAILKDNVRTKTP